MSLHNVSPLIRAPDEKRKYTKCFFKGCRPYSHSILSTHRNALIYKRKTFHLIV
jgi:hypothetical protein